MKLTKVRTDELANFPENLELFFNPTNNRMQLGFVDEDGNCTNPILEIEPHGGNFKVNPLANSHGPVVLDAGWPIISGYTKS